MDETVVGHIRLTGVIGESYSLFMTSGKFIEQKKLPSLFHIFERLVINMFLFQYNSLKSPLNSGLQSGLAQPS